MEISSTTVFKRVWRVSHELPEEGKVAFFDEGRSELVVVNAMGGAIWNLLDGHTTVAEISAILSEEVEGAPEVEAVRGELDGFLKDLLERRAIVSVDSDAAAADSGQAVG